MSSPLIGSWEFVGEPYQGLLIFTEKYCCHALMREGRKPFADEANPTDAEAAEAFKSMAAGSGTYSVSGSRLTLNSEMDRVPNGIGRSASWEFSIKDGILTVTSERTGNVHTYRKLEG